MASPDKMPDLTRADYSEIERRILAFPDLPVDPRSPVRPPHFDFTRHGSVTGRLATNAAEPADLPPITAEALAAKLKKTMADMPPSRPAGMPSLFGPRPASLGAMNVTVVHPPEQRKRSWKARLFSRPWRPWQKTEQGPEHPLWGMLDGENAYRVGDTLYVSPAGYATLKVAAKLAPIPV